MMESKTLGVLNLLGLVLLYLSFIPLSDRIAQVLFLFVAIMLFMKN